MAYFLTGLGYGVMILGAMMSLAGGIIVIVSLCSFMNWVGERRHWRRRRGGRERGGHAG